MVPGVREEHHRVMKNLLTQLSQAFRALFPGTDDFQF